MSDMKCGSCDGALFEKKNIVCAICGRFFHKRCSRLDDNLLKVISSNSNIYWKCSSCSCIPFEKLIAKISKLSSEIELLKKELSVSLDNLRVFNHDKSVICLNSDTAASSSSNSFNSHLSNDSSLVQRESANPVDVPLVAAFSAPSTNIQSAHIVDHDTDSISVISVTEQVHHNSDTNNQHCTAAQSIDDHNTDSISHTTKQRRMKHLKIFGTAEPVADFGVISRTKWIHLSRIKRDSSDDGLLNYISSNASISRDLLKCKRLVKKDTDVSKLHFVTYKIGVPEFIFSKILDASFWPRGVIVRKFINLKPKNEQATLTEENQT